jgi:hypothetical protein
LDGALESPIIQEGDHRQKVVGKVVNAIIPAASSIPFSGRSENSDRTREPNLAIMCPFYSGTSTT